MVSVYLVQPRFPHTFWGWEYALQTVGGFSAIIPPLALATLASLTPPEHRVVIGDEHTQPLDLDTPADIVGITSYLSNLPRALELADHYRARGKTVVMGGPGATLMPDVCRPHCDVLFEGEAEYTWPRFLDEYTRGCHRNHYVQEQNIDIADSPPPRLDLLNVHAYGSGIVQTTRGCPFTCEFCDIIVMLGRTVRQKPVSQVVAEVEAWAERGQERIFFADDNFVGNRTYAKELLRALAALNRRRRSPITFSTQVSIDMARDTELLEWMRNANFTGVFIGIETPRKASLQQTKKLQNATLDLAEAIQRVQSYGLVVWAGMIVGFDTDDEAIFEEQYQFLQETGIPVPMLNLLQAVPKTPLYARLQNEGRLLSPDHVDMAVHTNVLPLKLSYEQLLRGYADLMQRVFDYGAFARRLLTNFSQWRADYRQRPARFRWWQVRLALRICRYYLVTLDRERRRFFWQVLRGTWRIQPRAISEAFQHLMMYIHLRRFSADVVAQVRETLRAGFAPGNHAPVNELHSQG